MHLSPLRSGSGPGRSRQNSAPQLTTRPGNVCSTQELAADGPGYRLWRGSKRRGPGAQGVPEARLCSSKWVVTLSLEAVENASEGYGTRLEVARAEGPKRHEGWQQQRNRSPPRGHQSHPRSVPPALLPAPGWQHPQATGAQLREGAGRPLGNGLGGGGRRPPPSAATCLCCPHAAKARGAEGPDPPPSATLGTFFSSPPAQAPKRLGFPSGSKADFIQTLHRLQQRCGHKNTQNAALSPRGRVFKIILHSGKKTF